jgi:hypothetical protein
MNLSAIKKILWAVGFLSLVPILVYLDKFATSRLSGNLNDWYLFSGYLGGLLGPFFSLLTLLVTLYIAYSLNEYEKRRDQAAKEREDVRSYLALFQYFTCPEFREKRWTAWQVLRRMLTKKEYADFVLKEALVCRYSDRLPRSEVYRKFQSFYKEIKGDKAKVLRQESEDRHMLDAVINFFELLAIKDVPKDNYKVCDFYYDSWRPLLCWYAKKLDDAYSAAEINKRFSNPPCLKSAITLLDQKYYHPESPDDLTYETIESHPILKHYLECAADDE